MSELKHTKMLMQYAEGEPSGTIINPSGNDSTIAIGGTNYSVPTLTADELTKAYNSVVAGSPTYITNKNGTSYFTVLQADSIQDVDIIIEYFGIASIEYHLEGSTVEVTAITQGGNGSTIELLWQNASWNSQFSGQQIPISNMSSYDLITILFKEYYSGDPLYWTDTFPNIGQLNSETHVVMVGGMRKGLVGRNIIPNYNGAYISFGVGMVDGFNAGTSPTTDIGSCIPLRVYGIKL